MAGRNSALAPVGLAAFWLALLSSVFHLGAAPHEVCADHGELVERSADRSADHSTDQGTDGTTGSAPAAEDEDRHDHCPILGQSADARAHTVVVIDAPPCAPILQCAAGTPLALVPAQVQLLRVAPKTSPPA